MATFVALINWTEQGIRDFRDTVKRADAFADTLERNGGKLRDIYWCLGPYDIVAVMEAPDDETITATALQLGSVGNVRTTTLRGFSRDEIQAIIDRTG
jgi:uncharacterized protein with GYD domain